MPRGWSLQRSRWRYGRSPPPPRRVRWSTGSTSTPSASRRVRTAGRAPGTRLICSATAPALGGTMEPIVLGSCSQHAARARPRARRCTAGAAGSPPRSLPRAAPACSSAGTWTARSTRRARPRGTQTRLRASRGWGSRRAPRPRSSPRRVRRSSGGGWTRGLRKRSSRGKRGSGSRTPAPTGGSSPSQCAKTAASSTGSAYSARPTTPPSACVTRVGGASRAA
mmetsp:Transcript_7060/g.24504  ORF Transcript_7060/g.24504 Transcript_7060/m.24504 type:complete len:223 (+) Transcript_7060:94-762(+)